MTKLILAPGERLTTSTGLCDTWDRVELVAGSTDIQEQRRIGAAVVLREMARKRDVERRERGVTEGSPAWLWYQWVIDGDEARAAELDGEELEADE